MIKLKTQKEIEILQQGGKILSNITKELAKMVAPGVTTADLDERAGKLIKEAGGRAAFQYIAMPNGEKFPSVLCTSINDEVVHAPALPGRNLQEGDLLKIDVGMEYPILPKALMGKPANSPVNPHSELGGYYTDMAITVPVGKISDQDKKLMRTTRKALELGINEARPGNTLNDIGSVIQEHVEKNGFSVVRDMVGHGVGHEVHEEPQIPHYRIGESSVANIKLEPGMVIAIEPMVNAGSYQIKELEDNMTYATQDGSHSAQFEHTIAITKTGNIIITS